TGADADPGWASPGRGQGRAGPAAGRRPVRGAARSAPAPATAYARPAGGRAGAAGGRVRGDAHDRPGTARAPDGRPPGALARSVKKLGQASPKVTLVTLQRSTLYR